MCAPERPVDGRADPPRAPRPRPCALTPAQRRVLVALCRPLRETGVAAPASNREIADELVLSVDTVKGTLSALFERFGLDRRCRRTPSAPRSPPRAAVLRTLISGSRSA